MELPTDTQSSRAAAKPNAAALFLILQRYLRVCLGFYNALGGVTVGCKGDTDIGALQRYLRVCLDFVTPGEPGKDNRQRFSSPNPIFSGLWA